MNIFTSPFLRKMGLTAACAAFLANADAATYTAVASGNFTAAATWGGTAPSTMISGDNIIIPVGVNVTLNQSVTIAGPTSGLTVAGSLQSATNEDLAITGGALFAGSGDLIIDSLTLGSLTSSLTFTGDILVRALTSEGISLTTGAEIDVLEKITLTSSITNLTNATISLMDEGRLYMAGGTLSISLSTVLDFNLYDVVYTDVSATTGLELTGTGLRNIYINVPSGNNVMLGADLAVTDTLHLVSGTLDLNGNNLSFSGDGNVAAGGSGDINASNTSDISITSNNSFIGSLRFAPAGSTVNNFTVNAGAASNTVNLGTDMNVAGTLSLQSGKLNVGTNNLMIASSGSVSGGSASSYVVASGGGMFTMNVNAGSTGNFMIGTSTAFAPISVMANTGSASGNVSTGVNAGVYANGGTTGVNFATSQPVVNATWTVNSSSSTNVNMNIMPMWSAAMELNGFNRTEAYVSSSNGTTWDVMTPSAATTSGGMYTVTRSGVTTQNNKMAVVDKDFTTGINDVATGNSFSVYPNPVVNTLYFKSGSSLNAPVTVHIYDVAGHLVKTAVADANSAISVSELSAGFYTAQFSTGQYKATEKFVKQ